VSRNRISFAQSAVDDLLTIRSWYTDQGVPEVGDRLVTEIFERVEALADHGELGRIVPEFGLSNLRELIQPPFRIVYRFEPDPDEGRVRIVRVWRSERLLQLP